MYTLQIFLCINLLKINGMKQEFIIFLYIPLYFYVHVIIKYKCLKIVEFNV